MSRPGIRICLVALLGNIVLLTGCENFLGFGSNTGDTDRYPEQPVTAKIDRPQDTVGKAGLSGSAATPDRATVTRVQTRLKKLGFNPGPVDGLIGPKTIRAVMDYQDAHHLPATGKITAKFLQHLEAVASGGGAKVPLSASLHTKIFPTYRPGTAFIYSNGDIDRVTKTKGATTQWVRNDGTAYTAHGNFLVPWSYWASDEERGTAKISKPAASLWPEPDGPEVTFSDEITVQRKDDPNSTRRWVEHWRCRNSGRRTIDIMAGRFKTLILVCIRHTGSNSPELVRTWYYAPNIYHFVRFTERDPTRKRTESIDLLAVQPSMAGWPPIIRAGLIRTLSRALEKAKSGSQIAWSSSGVDIKVTIEPRSRFVSAAGRPCRRFLQTWLENGHRWDYPAVACKNHLGKWEIPGIENKAFNPLVGSSKAF